MKSLAHSPRPPTVPSMKTFCSKCSSLAAVVMAYDYSERRVWLDDMDSEFVSVHGYPMCDRHASRLTPPVAWTLTDRRNLVRPLFPEAIQPTRQAV